MKKEKLDMSQSAAWACEKDLLSIESNAREKLPNEAKKKVDQCIEEKIPYANEEYGYFILACGQGPMFIWAEKR